MKNALLISCLIGIALSVSACTTTSTDALNLQEFVPSTQTPNQLGARKDGEYGKIGREPIGETDQITVAEKRKVKRTLTRDAAINANPVGRARIQDRYRRDLERMERLLDKHDRRKAEPDYDE